MGAPTSGNFADIKKHIIEGFERDFLLSALERNDGNVSQTAASIESLGCRIDACT